MFEIGRWYEIEERDHDGSSSGSWKVVDWQAPLLKLYNPHLSSNIILNTSSTGFHSAKLSKHQSDD